MMADAVGGWGWMMPGFGWIFMLIFWMAIIVGVVALAKWIFSTGGPMSSGGVRRPLDIVRERYARGEINRDQYEQMRRDLAT